MTIGELKIFIDNAVSIIGEYIGRLLLTLFGQIPADDVLIIDIVVLFFVVLWIAGFILTIMESIIETIRGAIKSTINFIKNKMFKLKTYRDLLASFIHLIFSALAYVIVYWGAFISGTVIFTWALITVLEIIIKEGTSNVIIWSFILIFSLSYPILIYFKHKAIYNVLGKELPLKLLFFIFGKNK